jgi:endonuclease/exonuclease/phosphatase family metal-dependent hydrolase
VESIRVGLLKLNSFRFRNRRLLYASAGLGVIMLFAIQTYTAKNYQDPDQPFYSGNYAVNSPKPVEALTIVSYNIWFGLDTDQALLELKEINSQQELDIVLLQEMDEAGVEQIARGLRMNYVYYPAAVEPTYDKNFGNAILSSWPILDSHKLILPHKSLSNRMNRIATKATIRVHESDILVYSTHTESIFTLPRFREDQYRAILEDLGPEDKIIIGGDFNSFTKSDLEEIEIAYTQAGFARVSEGGGHTVVKYGIEVTTDHIFAKGFVLEETGKQAEARASDHLPIWVALS